MALHFFFLCVPPDQLMNPLLRLRQACCHPQAVRGEFVSMQRNRLTMAELLQSLTLKAKVESEEAHRQLVCALNGLAAVCVIKGEVSLICTAFFD